MTRRGSFLATVMAIALLCSGMASVAAQEATPAAAMFADSMGLPELRVRATDTAYEGLPTETPAGRYLLTLEAEAAEGAGLTFMRLPEGMSADDFMSLLTGPPAASPEAVMGTPGAEAGPPEGEGGDRPPDWYFQTEMAGGTGAFMGTAQAIIDLTPGEWIAWAGFPDAPQAPVGLTVTGEAGATPAAGAEPAADVTVTMFEYDFSVEGTLEPGSHVFAVTNVGAQPHEMFMLRAPGPVTEEQVAQILEMEMQGATPAPESGIPNPETFFPAAAMSPLSMGKTGWVPVNLEAGTYIMLCFVPDIESGMPHVYHGMYQVITVGDAGTPTA
ncbi:MAG TPA: hypothetical protein VHG52_04555 [Thermomicrobiales bacterium]|nr:hypothetical protein [Thermomicrobiales bacterium]